MSTISEQELETLEQLYKDYRVHRLTQAYRELVILQAKLEAPERCDDLGPSKFNREQFMDNMRESSLAVVKGIAVFHAASECSLIAKLEASERRTSQLEQEKEQYSDALTRARDDRDLYKAKIKELQDNFREMTEYKNDGWRNFEQMRIERDAAEKREKVAMKAFETFAKQVLDTEYSPLFIEGRIKQAEKEITDVNNSNTAS